MALLRLDLQIDSDVYPELYARLASIGRAGAREEKLRQLAATGLVWELVRMHGPALADLGPSIPAAGPPGTVLVRPEDLDGEARPSAPGLLAEADAEDEPESRPAPREGAGPRAVRRTPRSSSAPGVAAAPDLGISVPPVRPPLPEEAAPSPSVPMNLPVLLDVVDDADPLPLPLTLPEEVPDEVPSVTMATVVALRGDVDQPEVLDAGTEEAPPPALVPRTGRSSRLKRMKDKGLFQNG